MDNIKIKNRNKNKRRNRNKKPKALILFSGGLDSRLVVMMMKEQIGKKNIQPIFFVLPFGSGCCNEHCSLNFCQKYNIKLKIIDCTKGRNLKGHLKIIRKPKYGYGSGLNPCIDCRIYMLKKAKEYADKNGFDIIATGEVLNERPMSQYKKAMQIIEQESGLKGRLLRPLSAKLLSETEIEKKGLINREKLLDIRGRSRRRQIQLAKKYKINYPTPAGGCLLCEKEFARRLKPLLNKKLTEHDIQLLKLGRHFKNSQIILGRDKNENKKLEIIFKRLKKQDKKNAKTLLPLLLIPKQPGPTALIRNKNYKKEAERLIRKYSKHEIKKIEKR